MSQQPTEGLSLEESIRHMVDAVIRAANLVAEPDRTFLLRNVIACIVTAAQINSHYLTMRVGEQE